MNVALVYDRVNKWGGAERVLLALHKIWPEAPLYTAVYDKRASWADTFEVRPSFLQRIPFVNRAHESLPVLTPLAFESFSFDGFDLVISVTSAEAKNIITKPGTVHLCYCLTPTRYLWSGYDQYRSQPGLGNFSAVAGTALSLLAPTLRDWDLVASSRPDYYVAISDRVKKRIETFYRRPVEAVIRPPVDLDTFRLRKADSGTGAFYLTVSRFVGYKRLDVILRAFNRLRLPLTVIGSGRQRRELERIAGPTVTIVSDHLTDSELVRYYEDCRAFVFAADEDFGLAAAEAQAMGVPVISYRESGVAEIIKDGTTGILYNEQSPDHLIRAVREFETKSWDPSEIRKQARELGTERFMASMKRLAESLVAH